MRALAITPIAAALLIAGCGSAAKNSSSSSVTQASASSTALSTTASAPSPTPVTLITTKHGKLGTILADGPGRMTVYLFEKDKGGSSSCNGPCASVWPPVIGKPRVRGAAMAADLGTVLRRDGTTQLTYKGHPLYLFSKDKDSGDAYGQNLHSFGADWYALNPAGNKVEHS